MSDYASLNNPTDHDIVPTTPTDDDPNAPHKEDAPPQPPHRLVILITIAIFTGYAALVLLQHRLSQAMDLETSTVFQHGCSFNYIGNLIFRLAHNFVFSAVRPRNRVYISLGSMSLSMSLLGGIVVLGGNHWVGWSYICYFMGGVAIGTFESNLLTSITPLGHATKVWAIIGMPSGFALMSIGGFAYRSLPFVCDSDNALASLYIFVAVLCVLAMFVFHVYIPDVSMKNNSVDVTEFLKNVKLWRNWLPQLKWLALALACNMFSVSFFSGIMFYILNDRSYVPLFGQFDHEHLLVNHGWFFTIFNTFTFVGDGWSRRVVYRFKPRNPLWFLLVSAAGAGTWCSGGGWWVVVGGGGLTHLSCLVFLPPLLCSLCYFANQQPCVWHVSPSLHHWASFASFLQTGPFTALQRDTLTRIFPKNTI